MGDRHHQRRNRIRVHRRSHTDPILAPIGGLRLMRLDHTDHTVMVLKFLNGCLTLVRSDHTVLTSVQVPRISLFRGSPIFQTILHDHGFNSRWVWYTDASLNISESSHNFWKVFNDHSFHSRWLVNPSNLDH